MTQLDIVLRNGRVVRPGYGVFEADVGIKDGTIAAVAAPGTDLPAAVEEDISGLHVMPGVIDPHAHIGMGGGMEEYEPDTGAAALGGVTCVYYILIHGGAYLPLVAEHRAVADSSVHVDYGYHLTLMTGAQLNELAELRQRHGIRSFKYYMSFRGDEGAYLGVEGTDDGQFYEILRAVAEHDGVLAVHPENIEIVWRLRDELVRAGRDDLPAWGESRPPFTEAEAIIRAAYLGATTGCSLYFVHCSGADAINAVQSARREHPGAVLHAETCPHFLTHDEESDVGILGKVNPPLRTRQDIESLWQALVDGTVDTVGSDHVGRRRDKKTGTIWTASAGFPGLPTTLPVLLSEGHHRRGVPLERIAEVTARRPAQILRIDDRKGDIKVGMDADLAVVDLEWSREPSADWLGTWSDYSLYEGWQLRGWPRRTYVRGRLVQADGTLQSTPGAGQYLGPAALTV